MEYDTLYENINSMHIQLAFAFLVRRLVVDHSWVPTGREGNMNPYSAFLRMASATPTQVLFSKVGFQLLHFNFWKQFLTYKIERLRISPQ